MPTTADNLALIAELVSPAIRRDNNHLAAENAVLRDDIKKLLRTARDLAHQNLDYQDQIHYLEAMTNRLVQRVHRLEASILDCDDPSHNEGHPSVLRRRLNFEEVEMIDLTTDEVLTP